MAYAQTKEQAHQLIDRMAPGQVSVVVGLLEIMLDPVARSLANAPWEDEEISDEENRAVAESKAWLAQNPGQGTPHEDVLAEFGFTAKDAERMASTPPEQNGAAR
jgi:hypothetical protein